MILFCILLLILVLLAIAAVIVIAVGGTAFIAVFGDLIVFILVAMFIVKHLNKNKKG